MARTAVFKGLAATLLVALTAAPSWAAPTVAQMLAFKPKFDDVQLSTPAADEFAGCEVKLVSGAKQGASGWMLLDSKKQPVRKFFDSNGDKQIDMWSYFKDGVEVYREVDSNFDQTPDQFRWMGTAGMKWGVDVNQDGKIDSWRMISAEEAGQEAFTALMTNDFARFKALLMTEADIQALKLSQAESDRITKTVAAAEARFKATREKLMAFTKATVVRVEIGAPGVWPADEAVAAQDVFKVVGRTILFQHDKDKIDILHLPEMVQVGLAWRMVGAPSTEPENSTPGSGGPTTPESPKMRDLLAQLLKIDESAAEFTNPKNPKAIQYYKTRIALVQQIIQEGKESHTPAQHETWVKQILDGLSQAAVAGDETMMKQLAAYAEQYEKQAPTSPVTAYAAYRKLWASYANRIVDPKLGAKVQEEYNEQLAKFVTAYPKSEDAADACQQLAMQAEFNGKDEEAKRWYQQIATNFPESHLSPLAKGCIRRLDSVGQTFELTAGLLGAPGKTYDIAQSKGKFVVAYYWSSNCTACIGDFARMKKILAENKNLELVCINLDDTPEVGLQTVSKDQIPGIHVYQAGKEGQTGLRSPLATQYGIFGMPSLFLVGPDGKVVSRTVQVGDLEETMKKATK
ncbi:MAG: thioredoxin-like domain-containing protein [Gemmataceae bacterium]